MPVATETLFRSTLDFERQKGGLVESEGVQTARNLAVVVLPHAVRVQDLPEEAVVQERFARGLGSVAVGMRDERSFSKVEDGHMRSILDAIDEAARGNSASLEQNITVTSNEALTSEGIMEDVTITRDQDGRLQQFGQGLYEILENAIKLHPGDHHSLHEVTRTAALDYDVINMLDEAGYFDGGNVWVVPRIVPMGAPGRAVRRYGYFENLAVAWNFIWKTGSGEFKLRPMFTAGVMPLSEEESQHEAMTEDELDAMYEVRLARRHDIEAIRSIYVDLGLSAPAMTTDFLRGFIMSRDQFEDPEHPELDIAKRYDQKLGPGSFLGRKRNPEDISYIDDSNRRIEALRGLREHKQSIVRALIERRSAFGTDSLAAAYYLAKLVKNSAIDYVYDNPQYLDILGPGLGMAAYNTLRDGGSRDDVRRKARVNTCGFGDEEGNGDAASNGGDSSSKSEDGNKEEGPKSGKIRCIKCRQYVSKKEVVKKDSWKCPSCKHEVDICTGKVLNEGSAKQKPELFALAA